jgi:hypothetical protein
MKANAILDTNKKLVLNLDAIIRYAKFPKPKSLKELDKSIENYFYKNFHISENYIKDYEILHQTSNEVSAILVAINYKTISPFIEQKPKQLKLKQIETAKSIAKKESANCLLFTEDYYFYISNNTIKDIIDAKIFGPNWVISQYNIDKVYFLPKKNKI